MRKFIEYLESLNESKLLTSDFTFGFEFETCVKNGSFLYGKSYDEIKDILTADLVSGMPKDDIITSGTRNPYAMPQHREKSKSVYPQCDNDCSIKPDSPDDSKFEYDSPAFVCKPIWLKRVTECLEKWNTEYGCYTNKTCGFHVHIKFSTMTREQIIWLYCNMIMDNTFEKESMVLVNKKLAKKETYLFVNQGYSSRNQVQRMKDILIALGEMYDENGDMSEEEQELYKTLQAYINTEKYKSFRIHPKGTLEWRGPRDFMNHGNINNINIFFTKLLKVIGHFRKFIDLDTLTGTNIPKNVFIERITTKKIQMAKKYTPIFLVM